MPASKNFPDSFYRVTVKGICVHDGKILLIRESKALSGGEWELPGGGLDFGEDIQEGFKREVQEEMGLQVSSMSGKPVYVWTNKWEGERNMDWYYSCLLLYRVEFKDLDFTPSDECEEIKFFSVDEMKDLPLCRQVVPLIEKFDIKDFE